MTDVKDYIERVLAPRLQSDGGWVEFVSTEAAPCAASDSECPHSQSEASAGSLPVEAENEDGQLTLIFRGECSKCAMLERCVRWMEEEVFKDLGMQVSIVPVRKKPFFWDKD